MEVGSEVEYTIGTRGNSNSSSGNQAAENVRSLAKGTIVTSGTLEENQPVFRGVVKRPIRSHNADQSEYCGLIKKITEDGLLFRYYSIKIYSYLLCEHQNSTHHNTHTHAYIQKLAYIVL